MPTRQNLIMKAIDTTNRVNGILLLNKPQGLSSNAALQKVKRLFNAKKAGHTGSLDPLATGMLPICFGEATKFCQYLLESDKSYEATGLLGVKTTTSDSMGEVTHTIDEFHIDADQIGKALNSFRGTIKQVPSMFSALKHKGQPLYKLARKGQEVEREAREITIHQLDLLSCNNNEFDIYVRCSKGTYIRNLVEDIGDLLGVGAHVTRLHRPDTAGFKSDQMHELSYLESLSPDELQSCLLPMERAVEHFPALNLEDEQLVALRQGKSLQLSTDNNIQGLVRLYDQQHILAGLANFDSDGRLVVKRLLA